MKWEMSKSAAMDAWLFLKKYQSKEDLSVRIHCLNFAYVGNMSDQPKLQQYLNQQLKKYEEKQKKGVSFFFFFFF